MFHLKLLSHTKTKAELTDFLSQKVMARGEATGKQVVVAWATNCRARHKDVGHLQCNHEEADPKGAFFWDYSRIGILGIDGDRVLLEHIPFLE